MKSIKWLILLFLFGVLLNIPVTGQENSPTVLVDKMPEFPGGEDALKAYLTDSIKYPEEAIAKGIEGKVYVTFTIGKDGQVKNSKIAKGVNPLLDNESLRVVKNMPAWEPGSKDGTPLDVLITLPVTFNLAPQTK
ncbi:MAG TPA: energy transducer TonB [Mariniphaga sp.]|nr:energy transducer TonB [Mariniphaga sp.]